jgi:FeS assembly SUF system regulator
MLRVTKLADYGVLMLTHFASHRGSTYNARDMAKAANLPIPVVSKILKLLSKGGLLISQRGTKGGYGLARLPEQITIAAVIRALEGPIAMTECSKLGRDCTLETGCPVRTNWHLINQAIQSALENITLADMSQPLRYPLITTALPASPSGIQPREPLGTDL